MTTKTHHAIKKMSAHLASLIAAGEVIQQPVFAVKELIENALDAGATTITIEIEKGGMELIKVSDNGCGIAKDDLPLALTHHATSKILHVDDLNTLASLGFRGEALASMDAVSELTLASRTPDSDSGWQLSRNYHAKTDTNTQPDISIIPAAHPPGTTVILRHLFHNVPARRKFLRTERTEFKRIDDMVKHISLSRFNTRFILKHNGKLVRDFPAASTPREKEKRVAKLMSNEFIEQAFFVDVKTDRLCLWGWAAKPTFSRGAQNLQYFYVNGRYVKDRLLTHAVKKAYEDVLHGDRHPAFVLYLEIDPERVDVNVHPTKQEVRFQDSQWVYSFLLRSIKALLGDERPIDHVKKIEESTFLSTTTLPTSATSLPSDFASQIYQTAKKKVDNFMTTSTVEEPDFWKPAVDIEQTAPKPAPFQQEAPLHQAASFPASSSVDQHTNNHPSNNKTTAAALGYAIGQLKGAFILAENALGLIIVDIHAAHERIMYEKLKAAYSHNEGIPSQKLLIPVPVTLTESEADWVEQNQDLLNSLGLGADRLAPESISLREVPLLFKKEVPVKEFIYQLLPKLAAFNSHTEFRAHINDILADMACKQAVKVNQALSLTEMNALLREMEQTDNIGYCSHGRPTWHQLTLAEVNKFFLRGR